MRKMTDKEKLLQFKHRYYTLLIKEMARIIIQMIGMVICALYVCANFLGWKMQDIFIHLGNASIFIEEDYFNLICFVISIFLLIARPQKAREAISELRLALGFIKNGITGSDYQKIIISKAETYISEVDMAYGKKKSGHEDDIEPHEKRMVFRKWMILISIPAISILTAIMIFVFNWNVPQVASLDLLIGYLLVIYEAYYYQIQLKKDDIQVMTEKYKNILVKGEWKEEVFKFIQKICYMRADRLSNYCYVLGVAGAALNLISILITILETSTKKVFFQRLFALEVSEINMDIALIFTILSFVFFFVDLIVQFWLEPQIREFQVYSTMPYSEENYLQLQNVYKNNLIYGKLFSRRTLDWARGIYDYNNDALVRKYYRGEEASVPLDCMFTVESAYPGRIPRYKLTVLILWLCSFCWFVWSRKDILCIIDITIMAFVLYDIILLVNLARLWDKENKWLSYQKDIENEHTLNKPEEMKWDMLRYLFYHSVAILFMVVTRMVIGRENEFNGTIWGIVGIGLLGGLGYIFIKSKGVIQDSFIIKSYYSVLVFIVGVMGVVNVFIERENKIDGFYAALNVLIVTALLEVVSRYYRQFRKTINICKIDFPIALIFVYVGWMLSSLFVFLKQGVTEIGTLIVLHMYSGIIIIGIMIIIWGMLKIVTQLKDS